MPIYDIKCQACGQTLEVLVTTRDTPMTCPDCGSPDTTKIMSATSSLTGRTGANLPGPGDTACCGSHPGHDGCAGPGSGCGKSTG